MYLINVFFYLANNFKVETATDSDESQVWIYHETKFFEFYLRTEDFAKVYLTEVPMNDDNSQERGYEITFEAAAQKISIKQNPGGNELSSQDTPVTDGLVKR